MDIVLWREVLTLGIFFAVFVPLTKWACGRMFFQCYHEHLSIGTGLLLVENTCVAGLLEAPVAGMALGFILLSSFAVISGEEPKRIAKPH
ncbi:MAG: hypothetical protein V1885_00490 [Candidatus Brennerbacteria bacterium]